MMIAVELVSKPIEARIDEHSNIQKLYPRKVTLSLMVDLVFSKSDVSLKLNMS